MIIFYATEIDGDLAKLTDDEATHCGKVLRKRVGDIVFVTDGKGSLYEGAIADLGKKEVIINQLTLKEEQQRGHQRAIAIAPTKSNDRIEWFLEKATEIGITDIYPILTHQSERKVIKAPRWEKIIVSAMKQSMNLHKPILHEMQKLGDFINSLPSEPKCFIAHCMDPEKALQKVYVSGSDALVLIGPEGDFTEEEVALTRNHGFDEISLGNSRLRTETAGIVACHLLNL